MKFETYDSPNDLMNGIRSMVIDLVRGEIFKLALADPRYRRVFIQNPDGKYASGKDSISVYIDIDVSLIDHFASASLEIRVRLSDHPSNEMKDGDEIRKDGLTRIFIVREVGEAIRVRARNGIVHKWNDLDRKEHQVPLINGRDAVLPGDVRIEGWGSKYFIDRSERTTMGSIVNRIRSKVMDCIHAFVHQADC